MSYNEKRRLIWALCVIGCLGLVCLHGSSLILRYRTYPTRIQLDVVNKEERTLPAITVCPLDHFDLLRLKELWLSEFNPSVSGQRGGPLDDHQLMPNASEQYYQLADVIAVDQLWSRIAYDDPRLLFPMVGIDILLSCVSSYSNSQ